MKRLTSLIVVVTTAVAALAAVSPTHTEWFAGPVQHLMTTAEKERWKSVKTDEEARAFVELFWARRDPTTQTPRNEFREEFEARIVVADRDFTNREERGSMTDRGRVLILLGPPSQIGARGAEARSRPSQNISRGDDWDGTVPSARAAGARQVWTYRGDRVPKVIKRKEFDIIFIDEGRDEWQMATTERVNPQWILQQAAESYIVSPNLMTPPKFAQTESARTTSFRNAALKSAYETFKAEKKTSLGSAPVTWGEFVSPAGERFVAVQLYVPSAASVPAGQDVTFFGAIENEAGQIVEVHESAAQLAGSGTDLYVDRTLRLEPGTFNATFGLATSAGPIVITPAKITVRGLNPTESGISEMILSENIYPLPSAWSPTDPFTFGGLKVIPKGDAVFGTKGNLWYFFELRNPGLNDQGQPKVQVRVDISGKSSKGPVSMNFPMADAEIAKLKGTENRYAVGMAIPLESFKPGEYTMRIRVVDSILKKNYDFEKKFRVL